MHGHLLIRGNTHGTITLEHHRCLLWAGARWHVSPCSSVYGLSTGSRMRPAGHKHESRAGARLAPFLPLFGTASGDPTLHRTPTHPANGYGLVRRRLRRLLLMPIYLSSYSQILF